MGMLELGAIDLNHGPWVAKQNLRRSFHDSRLTRTGRTEEQQVADRAPRRVQSGTEHLIEVHQRLHALFLAHDLRPQRTFKIPCLVASYCRIQLLPDRWSHDSSPTLRIRPIARASHENAARSLVQDED